MTYLLPFPPSIHRSQDYGANPNNGINPPGGHNGDDWATPEGTPVRAAGDGEIIFAGTFDDTYADNWGWNLHYGGVMVILNCDGPHAPYFEYGHLSRALVKAGDRVTRGQVIAYTGNTDGGTGISTGPHCHVGCLEPNFDLGSSTYGRVNPRKYMTEHWTGLSAAGSTTHAPTIEQEEDMPLTEQQAEQLAYIASPAFKADIFAGGTPAEQQARALFIGQLLNHGVRQGSTDQVTSLASFLQWYAAGLDKVYQAVLTGTDPDAIAGKLIDEFGEHLAGDIVAAVGRKLAG